MDSKKFLLTFALASSILLLLVISFNIIANPYGVYEIGGSWVGINRYAAQGEAMERLFKPIKASAYAPETIIVGNSLSNIGLNPKDYEELTGRRTYNLSIDSGRQYELRRYVEHMLATDPNLREVIAAVDITMLYPAEKTQPGFDERQIGHSVQNPLSFAKTALSMDAIKAGVDSLRLNKWQRIEYPSHYASGMVSDGQQERNYGPIWFYKFLQLNLRIGSEGRRALVLENLDEYRLMQRMCAERGVEFRMFIPPTSAAALAAYAEFYGEDAMAAFLSTLSDIAPCYDFGNIGPWSETASRFDRELFWDAHHMKPALGKWVLAVLAGQAPPASWEGFGVLLNGTDIQKYMLSKKNACLEWRTRHPGLWNEVSHMGIFVKEERALPEPGEGMVHLDEVNGHPWHVAPIEMQTGGTFSVKGWSANMAGQTHNTYLALRRADGVWYTSLAAPEKRDDVKQLALDDGYSDTGFSLQASMEGLVPGEYDIYLWEEAGSTGRVSKKLGAIHLKD